MFTCYTILTLLPALFFSAGTKEIVCGVDEETGDISLSFEACEIAETSKYVWSKSYKEITDSGRVSISSKGKQ